MNFLMLKLVDMDETSLRCCKEYEPKYYQQWTRHRQYYGTARREQSRCRQLTIALGENNAGRLFDGLCRLLSLSMAVNSKGAGVWDMQYSPFFSFI